MWKKVLGPVQFSVEHLGVAQGGGPSLSVTDHSGDELLRFDCFYREPAFHIDPKRTDDITPLPALADNVSWTLAELDRNLSQYLERAGFELEDESGWTANELADLLSEAESAMRNPPAQLDPVDLDLLHSRQGEKWNTYPEDVLPAWVAEMDFTLAEPIRLVLQRAADRGDVGYPTSPRQTGLPESFAERMSQRFRWDVDASRVEVISDVVQGMVTCLEAYSVERNGVVVQTPIYPPFLHAVSETGLRLVENPLVCDAQMQMHFDLERLRADVDSETGVILLCNPHNPSGRVYTQTELEALADIALERNLVVVSDEIHADLVYAGHRHIPFASLGPEVARRTVTLTSATKAFNIPGLRCAVAYFGSLDLQKLYRAAHPRSIRGGIGLLGIYATLAAWRHSDPWLDEVRSYLENNRTFLKREMAARFPSIGFVEPEATYLAWLDCRQLQLSDSPATHFLRHGRVALTDGRAFGGTNTGFARINFATSRALLTEALKRMEAALSS